MATHYSGSPFKWPPGLYINDPTLLENGTGQLHVIVLNNKAVVSSCWEGPFCPVYIGHTYELKYVKVGDL